MFLEKKKKICSLVGSLGCCTPDELVNQSDYFSSAKQFVQLLLAI